MKSAFLEIFERLTPTQILGLNIRQEARSDEREGQVAVGSVVLNRVDYGGLHPKWGKLYGDTILDVITAPWQFSWCNGGIDEKYADAQWTTGLVIASDWVWAWKSSEIEGLQFAYGIAAKLLAKEIPRNVTALEYETIESMHLWNEHIKANGHPPTIEYQSHKHKFYKED